MVKVKMLRNTFASGDFCEAGKKVEVSEKDAKTLIAHGKAKPLGQNAPKVDNREKDMNVSTREVKAD